jgi:membrane-associated phospholipid phosphatase
MSRALFTAFLFGGLLIAPSAFAGDDQSPAPPSSNVVPQDRRDLVFYPGDTENVKPLTRKLVYNILLDQKAIWTSPFHADKKEALEWLGFTAVTGALIATDHQTSQIFENSQGQINSGNIVSKLGSVYTVLPAVAGFYIYGAIADNQKARETGVLGGEALLDGLIVSELLKLAAGRNRPNAPSDAGHFFKGGASFPSGHSIASWALASVIAHEYGNHKWVPFVAYGLAGCVGAARFAAQEHYAADIFAGSAMGYFIGRYVVNTHEAHALHHHGVIAPIVQPSTRTFGVSVSIGAL